MGIDDVLDAKIISFLVISSSFLKSSNLSCSFSGDASTQKSMSDRSFKFAVVVILVMVFLI